MRKLFSKYLLPYGISEFLSDVAVALLLWGLLSWLLPHLNSQIAYTYEVFYGATRSCFPSLTMVAFAIIFVVPHLLAAAIGFYFFTRITALLRLNQSLRLLMNALAAAAKTAGRAMVSLRVFIMGVISGLPLLGRRLMQTMVTGIKAVYKNLSVIYERGMVFQLALATGITLAFTGAYYILSAKVTEPEQFFKAQLKLSHILIGVLLAQLILVAFGNRNRLRGFFENFLGQAGSPYNLAIFRLVVFCHLQDMYNYERKFNSFWAAMPAGMRVDLPLMGWFIQSIPINPEIYYYCVKAGVICSTLALWGLFTRWAMIINIPLSIYIIGVPMFFGKLFHEHIWVWFPAILAFSPCADVLSADWLIKKYVLRQKPETGYHAKYFLPLKLVWLSLGVIYFFAGLGKLRDAGLTWALGESMVNRVQVEWVQHYNKIPSFRIDHYPFLLHAGGILTILFELFFPFLLFSSIGRLLAFSGGLTMHNAIKHFMYIGFEALQKVYVSLIDWHGLASKMLAKAGFAKTSSVVQLPVKELLKINTFKYVLITGIIIITANFWFSLFEIHSWPFSSFPTYSTLAPSYHHYVYFKIHDKEGNSLDFYELGKKNNFRMESYTPIEDRVYDGFIQNDSISVKMKVESLWNIWIANVPQLREADSVAVYLRTSPVAPEKANEITEEHYLYSFKNVP